MEILGIWDFIVPMFLGCCSFTKRKPDLPWLLCSCHGNHCLFAFHGAAFCPAIGIPYFKGVGLDPILGGRRAFRKITFYKADVRIPCSADKRYPAGFPYHVPSFRQVIYQLRLPPVKTISIIQSDPISPIPFLLHLMGRGSAFKLRRKGRNRRLFYRAIGLIEKLFQGASGLSRQLWTFQIIHQYFHLLSEIFQSIPVSRHNRPGSCLPQNIMTLSDFSHACLVTLKVSR